MQRYNGQLINQFPNAVNGNAAAGAQVTVRLKSTGALATLYATDSLSGGTLPNPLTADTKGFYSFYAPDGVYTLDVSLSGTPQLEIQLQDVASLQSQFNDAVSNAGYIPVGTFSAGCTVSQENGVVSDGVSYWRWDGSLPKTVTAGSAPVPTGVGGWVLVSDTGLRGDLADSGSTVLVGGQPAKNIVKIVTLATAVAENNSVGANYEISDRGGAACVVVAAGDVGGIYLATLANGNKLRLKSTSLFINEQNIDSSKYNIALFGGALRRTPFGGSNKWEWVQDSAHEPQGVTATITDLDAYQFQINYSNSAGNRVKVGTTLFALDYELAPYGVMTGANGGINSSIYQMYAPCRLFIESLSSVTASPLWTSSGLSISYGAGVIVVGHAPRALNVDPPVLSRVAPAAGSQHNAVYDVLWGATSTTITAYDYIGGLVQYNGSIMTVTGSKNINLSATVSGGVVTVTHDSVDGDFIPQLTMFGSGAYIPHVLSVNATTVQIGFKDTAGTLITSPNTAMSFYISRNGLVKSAIDSGVRMCVDLGLCRVKNSDVGNISLNNWWVMGFNNATV